MAAEQFHTFVSFDFWSATGDDAQQRVDSFKDDLPPDAVVTSQIMYDPRGKPDPPPSGVTT